MPYDRKLMATHLRRLYPDRGAFAEILDWLQFAEVDPGDE